MSSNDEIRTPPNIQPPYTSWRTRLTPYSSIVAAIPRLGFTGLCTQDGPTALNRADLVSVFPAGLTAAASWDEDLIYARAHALASEFREKGVQILLG